MIKRNKNLMILTSALILLPILLGLLLWGRLPDRVPSHWNLQGQVDGWSGKAFSVFFLPLFLLAAHWFIVGCMCLDPKSKNIEGKALALSLWVMPVFCILMSSFVYASALGVPMDIRFFLALIFGLMYILVGNYLPKCRPNYTIGIRVPWTLDNDSVWTATHRLAGKIWVVCGVVLLLTVFFGYFWPVLLASVLISSLVPILYSIRLSRQDHA